MVWNVVHNFPGAKDTYEVPVDYPNVGYDTIIASWFTDIFTSILAMQDSLLDLVGKVLLLAGGAMTGDLTTKILTISNEGGEELGIVLKVKDFEGAVIDFMTDAGEIFPSSVTLPEGYIHLAEDILSIGDISFIPDPSRLDSDLPVLAGKKIDGIIIHKPVWPDDIEVSDKTKGLILKSPNDSRFRLEVSDGGVLSTEAL